jgi:hypothetical protein
MKNYDGFVANPGNIAAIVGGSVGGLVLIGLGIFFYRRHKTKKLSHQLADQTALV